MRHLGLYTGEIVGEAYNHDTKYYLVIITKWSGRDRNAKEVAHKAFYFSDREYVCRHMKNELWRKFIYENYQEFTKFTITFAI